LFKIYIRRAAESFGVTRTREIYQKAIESLPDKDLNEMCLQFAKMEQGLGEVDRARSIRQYGAQFCDPSVRFFHHSLFAHIF
jgi:pre-mRNA-splicing factor SYF1